MTTRSAHDGIHHNLRKIMVHSQKSLEITRLEFKLLPFFFNNKLMEPKIMTAFPHESRWQSKSSHLTGEKPSTVPPYGRVSQLPFSARSEFFAPNPATFYRCCAWRSAWSATSWCAWLMAWLITINMQPLSCFTEFHYMFHWFSDKFVYFDATELSLQGHLCGKFLHPDSEDSIILFSILGGRCHRMERVVFPPAFLQGDSQSFHIISTHDMQNPTPVLSCF